MKKYGEKTISTLPTSRFDLKEKIAFYSIRDVNLIKFWKTVCNHFEDDKSLFTSPLKFD